MATADAGKRRSSGGEDKDVSGSGKKKRRRSRSRAPSAERGTRHLGSKKKSRKKKKEKNRERKGGRLKVQSIAELAELVKSGQVQIPRSLVEYQSDKLQLLDQVFAILSPDDVKGMLPDILKNLKMKHVKQLCYDHLKTLSEEEIRDTILPSASSASPSVLPQEMFAFQDPELNKMPGDCAEGGNSIEESNMRNIDPGKDGDKGDGGKGKDTDMGDGDKGDGDSRKVGDMGNRDTGKDADMGGGDKGDGSFRKDSGTSNRSGKSGLASSGGTNKGSVGDREGGSDSEIVITISDVSEGSDDDMETRGGVTDFSQPTEMTERNSQKLLSSSAKSSAGNQNKPVKLVRASTAGLTGTTATASGTTSGGVRGEGTVDDGHPTAMCGDRANLEREKTAGSRGLPSKHSVEKIDMEERSSDRRTKRHHSSRTLVKAVSKAGTELQRAGKTVSKEVEEVVAAQQVGEKISKGATKMDTRQQISERDRSKPKDTEQPCAHRTEREPSSKGRNIGHDAGQLGDERPNKLQQLSLQTDTSDQSASVHREVGGATSGRVAEVSEPSKPEGEGFTVGSAQLLEMELRRRALEAELRRSNATKRSESRVPAAHPSSHERVEVWGESIQEIPQHQGDSMAEDGGSSVGDGGLYEGEEMVCEDMILLHPEYEESEEGLVGRDQRGQDGSLEVMEERLRQRALQAMLEKKRKNVTIT